MTALDGSAAWHALSANPALRWSGKGEGAEASAQGRLNKRHIVVPNTSFSLDLTTKSRVYAAGSCFARNIEDVLIESGVEVLSKYTEVALSAKTGRRPNAFLNRYNTGALAQEFITAFQADARDPSLLVQLAGDKAIDLSLCQLPAQPLEVVRRLRTETSASFKRAAEADLLIFTLGVNEVWRDRQTGAWLNITPPRQLVTAIPDRFIVHELSPEQNFNNIQKAINLARQARGAKIPVVLTVSPVPLEATFFGDCVISQTFKGKSILRVAAAMASEQIDNVFYFPSYEAAMVSADTLTWDNDYRHPTSLFVAEVVGDFLARQGLGKTQTTQGITRDIDEDSSSDISALKHHLKQLNMEISRLNHRLQQTSSRSPS
jgi:hypothetical protein